MFIMYMLTSLVLTMASAMLLTMNPLSLGIVILLTALALTFIYSLMMTSWIAFLIFLIYVGGMLVMFAYFVALVPNQQMNQMMSLPMIMVWSITLFMLTYLNSYSSHPTSSLKNMSMMYMTENIQLLLILALILLFTMIVVVKLVTNNKGPLRPFMN